MVAHCGALRYQEGQNETMTESASSKDQRPYERFTLKMAVELRCTAHGLHPFCPKLSLKLRGRALSLLSMSLWCARFSPSASLCRLRSTPSTTTTSSKTADSEEDNVDVTDAVLVYNHINPASALRLAVGLGRRLCDRRLRHLLRWMIPLRPWESSAQRSSSPIPPKRPSPIFPSEKW